MTLSHTLMSHDTFVWQDMVMMNSVGQTILSLRMMIEAHKWYRRLKPHMGMKCHCVLLLKAQRHIMI